VHWKRGQEVQLAAHKAYWGGAPKIDGSWRYDDIKKQVEVTLSQGQPAEPYRVNLDVGIVAKAGELPTVKTIALAAKQGTFTFPLEAAPASVVLDPNTMLLMDAGAFVKR